MRVKKQREQRHVLKGQGDCWQWKVIGQCSKGNNCSSWHDANKRARPTTQTAPAPDHSKSQDVKESVEAKSPRGRCPSGKITRMPCKDHLKGTCANPSCEKWHSPEWLFYKSAERCTFGDKCDKNAVALLKETKNLGCVFEDVEPPRSSSILRKISTTTKPIRCVKFTTAVLRNAKLRDQNPSLGYICHGDAHQCSPNAPKLKDRSREGTEWQEHWAREAAWRQAAKILKSKEKHNGTFFSPPPRKSGASRHHPKLDWRKENLW